MIKFDLPKDNTSIIKVIGVGGGGSNAVNHMFRQGIKGVDFIVCNTDRQALDISPVPIKIILGESLTEGLGAGSLPEVGKNAAIETIEELRNILSKNTKMVFITAGMGGGTGTGAAPVIARVAKEMGILTVAIVTIPFAFEGKKRRTQADDGLEELRKSVDTLLVISNDKLREIYGNLKLTEAFGRADDVLTTAAKGIADIITTTLHINTDFADITTVMKDSGVAIMGSAQASGENRAIKAVELAMNSPLLNDSNIRGARYVLLNITCGNEEITMDELGEITDFIQESAGMTAEIIKGYGVDETLGDKVNVTIIATGFSGKAELGPDIAEKPKKIVHTLDTSKPAPKAEVVKPVEVVPVAEVAPVVEAKPVEIPVVAEVKVEAPAVVNETPAPTPLPFNLPPSLEPVLKVVEPVAEIPVVAETSIEETIEVSATADVINMDELQSPIEMQEVVAEVTTPEVTNTIEVEESPVVNEITSETTVTSINEVLSEEDTMEPFLITRSPEEKQVTIEFEINNTTPPVMETPSITTPEKEELMELPVAQTQEPEKVVYPVASSSNNEEQMKKAQERIMKLKEMSYKVKTPTGIHEMENEPAYKRRNVQLNSVPHSSESQVSRYTLTEGENNNIEIKPNNSFLHDNVD